MAGKAKVREKENTTDQPSSREIKQQIEILENNICSTLCSLRLATSELEMMEQSNKDFLKEYFKNVGVLFEEIKKLDNEIGSLDKQVSQIKQCKIVRHKVVSFPLEEETESLEELQQIIEAGTNYVMDDNELKSRYRKLVKMCHPDMYPERNLGEYFNLINQAYQEKNLQELIRIERLMANKDNDLDINELVERLDVLEKEYNTIQNEMDDIKIRRYRLVNSPGYLLQQKFSWAKLCGRNLISEVINDALKQIRDKKKILMQQRTELAYMLQKKAVESLS